MLTSGGSIQILSTLSATNAVETINAPLVIEGASGTYTFANNSSNGTGAGAGTLNFGGGITKRCRRDGLDPFRRQYQR